MSYRDDHPIPPIWTDEQSCALRTPDPYDQAGAGELHEIDAPDGSTTFLMSTTCDNFEGNGWPEYFTSYGIEAPQGCKMRQAFEWGEISWREFWTHKGWVLHMRAPFQAGPMQSSYISPIDLCKSFNALLDEFGHESPYDFKRQQLELKCIPSPFKPKDLSHAEREYQQFMMRHGHKLARRAA